MRANKTDTEDNTSEIRKLTLKILKLFLCWGFSGGRTTFRDFQIWNVPHIGGVGNVKASILFCLNVSGLIADNRLNWHCAGKQCSAFTFSQHQQPASKKVGGTHCLPPSNSDAHLCSFVSTVSTQVLVAHRGHLPSFFMPVSRLFPGTGGCFLYLGEKHWALEAVNTMLTLPFSKAVKVVL